MKSVCRLTSFRLSAPRQGPAAAVLFAAGCLGHVLGCTPSHERSVFPVKGQVFVRSQPAAGARVILRPMENANPEEWTAGYPRGMVADDGSFQVSTYGSDDGAPAGDYVVLVEWR